MNMFYSEAIAYKEYKDKIDLSNLTSELFKNFNQEFYTKFIKTVICDLSLSYKHQFIQDWFAAILTGDKRYSDNIHWLMDLFDKSDLLNMSNDGTLFSIIISRDSNIFDSYNDYMTMRKYFIQLDNFKDYAFILAKDEKIERSVLDTLSNLSEFNFFRKNMKKTQEDLYIYVEDPEKEEKINNKEKYLKIALEKEKIENNLDKSVSSSEDNIKKRL